MELESFVFSAVLLLAVASIAVALSKQLRLGSVLGLLLAGIIVGPHTPGPYITLEVEGVRNFTELGVVMLLFLIGLEMQPSRLWAMRRAVFGLGSLQILVAGLCITLYATLVDYSWEMALLSGLTLALSSTAFVMQILRERGEIASQHGQVAFAILLMQDLAVVPLLALVPFLAGQADVAGQAPLWERAALALGMFGLLWAFGRHALPLALQRLALQNNREGFALLVLLAVFLAAWAMHHVGLSMVLGAFVMGMLLSGSTYHYQIEALIEPYKGMLMSLFFVAVGMSIDPAPLLAQPLFFAQQVLVVVAIKLVVLFLLGLVFRLGLPSSIRVTFLLAQAGEFGFVLFGAARAIGLIHDTTFSLAVSVISASLLITPLLVRLGDALARRFEQAPMGPAIPALVTEDGKPTVILAGYGRVGHTVAVILHSTGIPFIVFDQNPERVARGKADGFPVYYGDIGDPALWDAAQTERAALVVITVDHGPTALRAVSHLRNGYPQVPVVSRARDLEACGHLLQAGAAYAFPEAIESSLRLGAQVLEMVGVPGENVDMLMQGVRRDRYALVRDEPSEATPNPRATPTGD